MAQKSLAREPRIQDVMILRILLSHHGSRALDRTPLCLRWLILQNKCRRGRIGNWNVIIAVRFLDPAGQRAAHRHPVQKFDALRAGALDELRDRVSGEAHPAFFQACPGNAGRIPC
jgi:hypothetical protein